MNEQAYEAKNLAPEDLAGVGKYEYIQAGNYGGVGKTYLSDPRTITGFIDSILQCPNIIDGLWEGVTAYPHEHETVASYEVASSRGIVYFCGAPWGTSEQSFGFTGLPSGALPEGLVFQGLAGGCAFILEPTQSQTQAWGSPQSLDLSSGDELQGNATRRPSEWIPEWLSVIKVLGSLGSDTRNRFVTNRQINEGLDQLEDDLDQLMSVANEDEGWEADFADELNELVKKHELKGAERLRQELANGFRNFEVLEETLVQLGSLRHEDTLSSRFSILVEHLRSNNVRLRHAAALGIAESNHASAVKELRIAERLEDSSRLRKKLNQIILELERTQECLDF